MSELVKATKKPFITVGFSNADYICDGVADDVQIQQAITALGSGGRVFIKKSTSAYVLAATVTFAANNIEIEWENGAIVNFPGNTVTTAFKVADTTQRIYIRLINPQINSTSGGSGLGIDASHFAICRIENPIITGCNKGIDFNATDTLYNYVDNPRIAVSGSGSFGIRFTNGANENTVMRTRIGGDANTTGIIVNAYAIELYSPEVETGTLVGIDVQSGGHGLVVVGPYLESNITNLKLASGVEDPVFIAGNISGGSTANITDNGAVNPLFIGVRLEFDPYTVLQNYSLGLRQNLVGVIFTGKAVNSIGNVTSPASVFPASFSGSKTLPATFLTPGKTIRVRIKGNYTTALTTTNATLAVKLGSTTIATVTVTSIASATNLPFIGEVDITCYTTGASGTVAIGGGVQFITGLTTMAFGDLSNGAATTVVDTTASKVIDVVASFGTSVATQDIVTTTSTIEILN